MLTQQIGAHLLDGDTRLPPTVIQDAEADLAGRVYAARTESESSVQDRAACASHTSMHMTLTLI